MTGDASGDTGQGVPAQEPPVLDVVGETGAGTLDASGLDAGSHAPSGGTAALPAAPRPGGRTPARVRAATRGAVPALAARLAWGVIDGEHLDADAEDLLDRGIGGVVLFSRNLRDPGQIRDLTAAIRRRASGPVHIALDQEGGHVVRIGEPLTRFPSAMALGATRSEVLTFAAAKASGEELHALGVDVVLAPVLDVATDPRNPTVGARSFGADPDLVARLGIATLLGYRAAGITAVPKHFPGHGRTSLDSHVASVRVTGGRVALASDLVPFHAAVGAGARIVMVSHIVYAGVSNGLPATLSQAVMHGLLRRELGFEGLVLTDAMVMDAVLDGRSPAEACVGALLDGDDVVMPLEPQRMVLPAIERAIADGVLGTRRLEATIRRLDHLDALTAADAERHVGNMGAPEGSGASSHRDVALAVARASMTLVRGRRLLPVTSDTSVLLVEQPSERRSPIEDDRGSASVAAQFRAVLPRTRHVAVEPARAASLPWLDAAARSSDLVVLATRDAFLDPAAPALVRRLQASGRPVALVAMRSPWDCAALPRTDVAIATYADVPASMQALLEALTGSAAFPGRAPIPLERPQPAPAVS